MTESAWVAGVDEAGRGPLAGPLAVAAVILDPRHPIAGLDDSKRLSAKRRESLSQQIREQALAWSLVMIEPADIDRMNILQATMHGMRQSLLELTTPAVLALIDGNRLPNDLPCPARAIIGGDASEPAISAASIIAKVARDAFMCELDDSFPGYGFAGHKGYPTRAHVDALMRLGPCPQHRRSYAPVRRALAAQASVLPHPV